MNARHEHPSGDDGSHERYFLVSTLLAAQEYKKEKRQEYKKEKEENFYIKIELFR